MRSIALALPILVAATSAAAQPAPVAPQVQQVLADPATAERLTNVMQTLSKALLDVRVGDVQAALEGRQPNAADHRRTVASETGMSDAELRARIAAARPVMERSIKALNQALPSMIGGLQQAQQALDRAAANMPDPNYPKR